MLTTAHMLPVSLRVQYRAWPDWAPLMAPWARLWVRLGQNVYALCFCQSECTFVLCVQASQCLVPWVPCVAVRCLHALCLCAVGGVLQVHVLVYLLLCALCIRYAKDSACVLAV